jgi:protein-disulfide isomerase
MRVAHLLGAIAAVALIGGAPAAKPAAKTSKPAARDWTKAIAATPEGGFRMGNPAAKIAIVEYGSLTCPHCRHFAQTGMKPLLQNYVRTGKASYEYRSMILNGLDLAATLLARCGGASRFFPMADKLYATQPAWIGKFEGLPTSEKQRLQKLSQPQMMVGVAKAAGLVPIAAAQGIAPARAQACLTNPAAAERLAEMYQAARDRGVKGTPTFFVNGTQVPAADWPTLEPHLRGARPERG